MVLLLDCIVLHTNSLSKGSFLQISKINRSLVSFPFSVVSFPKHGKPITGCQPDKTA